MYSDTRDARKELDRFCSDLEIGHRDSEFIVQNDDTIHFIGEYWVIVRAANRKQYEKESQTVVARDK